MTTFGRKSVVKSAASVRPNVSVTKPKPKRLIFERPTSGTAGGNRTGTGNTQKTISTNKSGGKPSKSKTIATVEPDRHNKALAKARVMRDELIAESKALAVDMPVAAMEEKEYLDEYVRMFRQLKVMIEMCEKRYMSSSTSKEVYAMMTMYSQLREIIADIRSVTDMSSHAESLIHGAVQPSIFSVAQYLVDMFYQIRVLIRDIAREDQVQTGMHKIDEMMRDSGIVLQDEYEKAATKIREILVK